VRAASHSSRETIAGCAVSVARVVIEISLSCCAAER
jgi:hypothetical protein